MFVNDKNLTLKENLDAFKIYAKKEMDHIVAIEFNWRIDKFNEFVNTCPVG